jgi:glycosyltransferase involved in cell wall biosynthesis
VAQVDVSVILATYQQLDSTLLALRALFAQQAECSYEVVVCDDGSDAGTVAAIRDALQAAPVATRLAWQQDRGFRVAASRNNGIRLARGRVLVFLDGDMVPEAGFVEKHLQAHAHGRIIAVGRRLRRNLDAITGRASDAEALWALLRGEEAKDLDSRRSEVLERISLDYLRKIAPWAICFSCNVSVTRSPLVEFDESFVSWGYEDWDLFYGLNVVSGFEVSQVEAIAYEVSSSFAGDKARQQDGYIGILCNAFRFLDKWAHTGLTLECAIPKFNFDPETRLWSPANQVTFGANLPGYGDYVETTRRWLVENGYYPAAPQSDG